MRIAKVEDWAYDLMESLQSMVDEYECRCSDSAKCQRCKAVAMLNKIAEGA